MSTFPHNTEKNSISKTTVKKDNKNTKSTDKNSSRETAKGGAKKVKNKK